MENSIEEDIEILESIVKVNNDFLGGIENQTINQKEITALQHILSDYKRVLKENEKKDKLIERTKKFLLKENKMFEFLESEDNNVRKRNKRAKI